MQVSYLDILKRELETRCAKNARYSLRAFARDLGLSPTSLSLLLNGKQGLSRQKALEISKSIGLNTNEQAWFCDYVDSKHARSRFVKLKAQENLENQKQTKVKSLQIEAFRIISDWYHFAILELTELEQFENSTTWIAKTLGVSQKAVELAIERLKKLELLEELNGKLKQTVGFLASPSGFPSEAIKKNHTQVLKKAEQALFTQSIEERDFSNIVLPINTDDLEWAKSKLKEMRREFMEHLEKNPKKNMVYCLAIQFFGLHETRKQLKHARPEHVRDVHATRSSELLRDVKATRSNVHATKYKEVRSI